MQPAAGLPTGPTKAWCAPTAFKLFVGPVDLTGGRLSEGLAKFGGPGIEVAIHFGAEMFTAGWRTDRVVGVKASNLSETNPHEQLTSVSERIQ
jgi:hypothetical protein